MSAQFRDLGPQADLEVRVEQAIARGWSRTRIAIELRTGLDTVDAVWDRLDAASRHKDVIGEPANLRRAG